MLEGQMTIFIDEGNPKGMPVTTRIITFLVGDPELNLHVTLLLGGNTQFEQTRFWRSFM